MALLFDKQTLLLALIGAIVLLAGFLTNRAQRRKAETKTTQPS